MSNSVQNMRVTNTMIGDEGNRSTWAKLIKAEGEFMLLRANLIKTKAKIEILREDLFRYKFYNCMYILAMCILVCVMSVKIYFYFIS